MHTFRFETSVRISRIEVEASLFRSMKSASCFVTLVVTAGISAIDMTTASESMTIDGDALYGLEFCLKALMSEIAQIVFG